MTNPILDKKQTFEERSKEWEKRVKPLCEELGVVPWATLEHPEGAIVAIPCLKDLWAS